MKAVVLGVVLLAATGPALAAELFPKDLVFEGTVERIVAAKTGDMLREWVVEVSVDKVKSGKFSNPTFRFLVHSPSRARLEVGGTYEITARWHGNGYDVDEWDIRRLEKKRR